MLICMVMGFTSGLPLFVLMQLMSAWLKAEGIALSTIGLFSLVGFCYTWKFLWSPVMDRFSLPFLGRRRGWICLTQCILLTIIIAIGQFTPQTDLTTIIVLCFALSFTSASQDIVIDAYRREMLSDSQQAPGTALFVNAYRLSVLVPGSLSFILSDYLSWQNVFLVTALFMLPGLITTLLIKEPHLAGTPPQTMREAIVLPFQEFIHRQGLRHTCLILSFIFFYKLGDAMASALQIPFFMDLGFTRTDIGLVAKNAGLWANIAGGILGAILLTQTGVLRGLWIFGAIQTVAILGFALLAKVGLDLWTLSVVIAMDMFAVGLGMAALTAYIATLTNPRYTATQFALFTSLASIPRTFVSATTGYLVEHTGWFVFFILCFILALPGMLLLFKIAPWHTLRSETSKRH